MITYTNPVVPGFNPDPSVCRVGKDYYMACSSFEFYPGLPLYHSRDLIHWRQVGNAIHRPGQLDYTGVKASGGLWAPTLRWHKGRFYIVCTMAGRGNFLVWAQSINGPWSDPVYLKQDGIDPSLFFDEDGTVYYSSNGEDENGRLAIFTDVLCLDTFTLAGRAKPVWYGTGERCAEAPHLYKIGGWYYLLIAEGGTDYGHMATIARAASPWGPFEACPHNPVLTHKNPAVPTPFQGVGHADLVCDTNGGWWLVCLGFRTSQNRFHHLGRETLLAPVEWQEGWPVVNRGLPLQAEMEVDREPLAGPPAPAYVRRGYFTADFAAGRLAPEWCFVRQGALNRTSLHETPGRLVLHGGGAGLDDCASPTFLGVRQPDFAVDVTAEVEIQAEGQGAFAGICVYHSHEHHYALGVLCKNGVRRVALRRRVADMLVWSDPLPLAADAALVLRIEATALAYHFYVQQGGRERLVGSGCTQLVSTEAMKRCFTGCFVGLFAEGEATLCASAFATRPVT